MDWFPIFLALNDCPALVVGGGAVAMRKTRQLLVAGCRVSVVSPACDPQFEALISQGKVSWRVARFEPEMVVGHRLVIAATGDPEPKRLVPAPANRFRVLVNLREYPGLRDFILPPSCE